MCKRLLCVAAIPPSTAPYPVEEAVIVVLVNREDTAVEAPASLQRGGVQAQPHSVATAHILSVGQDDIAGILCSEGVEGLQSSCTVCWASPICLAIACVCRRATACRCCPVVVQQQGEVLVCTPTLGNVHTTSPRPIPRHVGVVSLDVPWCARGRPRALCM